MQGQTSLLSRALGDDAGGHACPDAGPLLHVHVHALEASEPEKREGDGQGLGHVELHSATQVRIGNGPCVGRLHSLGEPRMRAHPCRKRAFGQDQKFYVLVPGP